MDTYQLRDKRVLVTGASSGIGWDLAQAFSARGAQLSISARREQRLEDLATLIESSGRHRPLVIPADLSRPDASKDIASHITERFGGLDVLVNNAGSAAGGTVWAVGDRDEARTMFEVDFWSPLALIAEFVPAMRHQGHGAVVNVTSLRQVLAWPLFGHSSAAKAALAQATETLRLELIGSGVRVVEVIAGPIETPAQGPTRLIPGIVDSVHGRFGVAEPSELASRVVHAVEEEEPRVFCPQAPTRTAYENPTKLRADIFDDVQRMVTNGTGLPDESLDDLVVGADDPIIQQARQNWEQEHAR